LAPDMLASQSRALKTDKIA